jgi:dCMP deaminase
VSKDQYYLNIANAISERSTCLRRRYGAIIVKDDIIVATGYNGSARGEINCCDSGQCEREKQGIAQGQRYDLCVAVHAEQNAIIQAGFAKTKGATLYLSGNDCKGNLIEKPRPCEICMRFIKNAGIAKVVCDDGDDINTITMKGE